MKKCIAVLLLLALVLSLSACGGIELDLGMTACGRIKLDRLRISENGMPLDITWDTPMEDLKKMIPSGQGEKYSDEDTFVAMLEAVSFEGVEGANYLLVNVMSHGDQTPDFIQLMVSGSDDGGQALYDTFKALYTERFGIPEEPEDPWRQTCVWVTEESRITMRYGFQTGNAVDFGITPLGQK